MMDNISAVRVFTLNGLNETTDHRMILFSVTLLCYSVILLLNVILIVTIITDGNLHEPMYIFLCNLCINGLYGTTGFYPKFLFNTLTRSNFISYAACLLQSFVIYSSACTDFSILTLMAYDRYVAICRPLVYHSVMTKQRVCMLLCLSWLLPHKLMFIIKMETLRLTLCGSHIQKLYCANRLVVQLACIPSIASNAFAYFIAIFYLLHFILIFWSYTYLIRTCVHSKQNRVKFLQTCVPHLICSFSVCISLFFDTMHMRFPSRDMSRHLQNFMETEFLIVPPVLNPLIYGLIMTKIRNRVLYIFRINRK